MFAALLAGCGGSPSSPSLKLTLTSPADGSYTNGTVVLTATAEGGTPASISFVVDDQNTVASPHAPYSSTWDTAGVAEGRHTLRAEAAVGESTVVSDPVAVIVDRTRPSVTSFLPESGSSNVVLRAPIAVTFSEPVLPSSVVPSAATLDVAGSVVPITGVLSQDGLTLSLSINDSTELILPARFSVTMSSEITDLAGNSLAPLSQPWQWTVPEWIKYDPIEGIPTVFALKVGTDFDPVRLVGSPVTGPGLLDESLSVLKNNGEGWSTLGDLNGLFYPGLLGLDSQGRPFVGGMTYDSGSKSYMAKVATWAGSTWDAPLPAITVGGSNLSQVVAKAGDAGRGVFAWSTSGVNSDVYALLWTAGGWDVPHGNLAIDLSSISDTLSNISWSFDVALTAAGDPILAIGTALSSAAVFWAGTSWTATPWVAAASSSIAVSPTGEPMLVKTENGQSVVVTYKQGAWMQTVPDPIPAGADILEPRVFPTADQQVVVTWIDTGSTPSRNGFARWTGAKWDARAGLFSGGGSVYNGLDAVVDGRGSVWFSWSESAATIQSNVWMSNY
jgi:hypothetical protein